MKVTVERTESGRISIELSNEAVKAIRFCTGFNTDLRVKLDPRKHRNSIWHFLDRNIIGIVGMTAGLELDNIKKEDFNRYEMILNGLTQQVLR